MTRIYGGWVYLSKKIYSNGGSAYFVVSYGGCLKMATPSYSSVTFTGKPTDVEKHTISNIPLIRLDHFSPLNQCDHFVGGNYKVGPGGAHFGGPRGPGRFRETRRTPWSNPNRCSSSCLQTSLQPAAILSQRVATVVGKGYIRK